jgi:hypothetical protein
MRIIPWKDETSVVLEVPLDDFETTSYVVHYCKNRTLDQKYVEELASYHSPYFNRETYDLEISWENRMGQDRDSMKFSWSGISVLGAEDFAMSCSLGEDYDRSKENLVASDLAVVRMRKMVLDAIEQVESGEDPPAVKVADMTGVGAYDRNISTGDQWQSYAPGNRLAEAAI